MVELGVPVGHSSDLSGIRHATGTSWSGWKHRNRAKLNLFQENPDCRAQPIPNASPRVVSETLLGLLAYRRAAIGWHGGGGDILAAKDMTQAGASRKGCRGSFKDLRATV